MISLRNITELSPPWVSLSLYLECVARANCNTKDNESALLLRVLLERFLYSQRGWGNICEREYQKYQTQLLTLLQVMLMVPKGSSAAKIYNLRSPFPLPILPILFKCSSLPASPCRWCTIRDWWTLWQMLRTLWTKLSLEQGFWRAIT